MKLFVNPYTGHLMDLDSVPVGIGGAKSCPHTGKPLNAEAVAVYSYPGPERDRETWADEAGDTVAAVEAQANQPSATTLEIS